MASRLPSGSDVLCAGHTTGAVAIGIACMAAAAAAVAVLLWWVGRSG